MKNTYNTQYARNTGQSDYVTLGEVFYAGKDFVTEKVKMQAANFVAVQNFKKNSGGTDPQLIAYLRATPDEKLMVLDRCQLRSYFDRVEALCLDHTVDAQLMTQALYQTQRIRVLLERQASNLMNVDDIWVQEEQNYNRVQFKHGSNYRHTQDFEPKKHKFFSGKQRFKIYAGVGAASFFLIPVVGTVLVFAAPQTVGVYLAAIPGLVLASAGICVAGVVSWAKSKFTFTQKNF